MLHEDAQGKEEAFFESVMAQGSKTQRQSKRHQEALQKELSQVYQQETTIVVQRMKMIFGLAGVTTSMVRQMYPTKVLRKSKRQIILLVV